MLSIVLPIKISDGVTGREIGVPFTVMAGPPGTSVWLSIIYCDTEFAVMVCEASLIRGGVGDNGRLRSTVLLPISSVPEGARDIGVPVMVMAGPPTLRVWLSMMY